MNKKRAYHILYRALPNMLVVLSGVLLFAFFANFKEIASLFRALISLISPFIAAFAIAYIASSPLNLIERRWLQKIEKKNVRRAVAVAIVYLLGLALVTLFISFIIPQIVESVRTLINQSGDGLAAIETFVRDTLVRYDIDPSKITDLFQSWEGLWSQALDFLKSTLPQLLSVSISIGSFVINTLVAVVASVYLLFSKEKFCSQTKRVVYSLFSRKRADQLVYVTALSHRTFGGFLIGKINDSLIIGLICFIGTSLLKIPFAPLVSVIVGVTNIIPFFGPFIGAVPSAFIILIADPIKCIWFVIFVIALQQFDGNFLGPKILGQSTGLSAFWVMVAIVIGGGLMGPLGMIVGVPAFSVIYTLFKVFIRGRLQEKGMPLDPNDYKVPGPIAPLPPQEAEGPA